MAQTKVGSGFVATGAVGPTSLSTGAPYWDTSGNVGVGTSSPNYQLQLYKGGAVANYLQVTSGATGTGAANGTLFGVDASGNGIVTVQGAVNYITSVAGVERMRIDSSGNVGIGAASPTSITKFYVEQSAGNVLGYFNSTAASQNARVRINSTDIASSVAYVWSYSNASLNKQASIYLTGTGALATQVGQTAGAEPTTGTTAMFIDSSGNVGVGTSSPSALLQAYNATTGPIISAKATTGYSFLRNENSSGNFDFCIDNSAGSTFGKGAYSRNLYTTGLYPVLFWMNGSEAARIDSSGRLLVGTTTAAGSANTFCSTAGAVQQALSFWNTATAGTRYMCTFGDSASYTERGNINWNGTTMTLATTSDRRLKTNIEPAIGGLEKVLATNVYSYDMHGGHSEFGVIAQEMIDVLPASVCVGEDNEDGSIKRPWSVGYEPMVPMLIKAIQELKAELDALKAKVGS